MRKIIILTTIVLLFTYCKKEDTKICGCDDPTTELQWLSELIQKAETDTIGIYRGRIYLEEYNNKKVFFTTMLLESSGYAMVRWFDCDGNRLTFKPDEKIPQPKMNHLIYYNVNEIK